MFNIHEGHVLWDGRSVRVSIDSAKMFPLIGMTLLEGVESTVQVGVNGRVTVEALP